MIFGVWLVCGLLSLIMFANYVVMSAAVPHPSWTFRFFAWFAWYRRRFDGAWYYLSFTEYDGGHPTGARGVRHWTQELPSEQEFAAGRVRRFECYRGGIPVGDMP